MNIKKVKMYTQPNCSFCLSAEALCDTRNIQIEQKIDIAESIRNKSNLLDEYEQVHGYGKKPRTVPQIWASEGDDWEYVGGYQELFAILVPERF